jgi:hypothetical protein
MGGGHTAPGRGRFGLASMHRAVRESGGVLSVGPGEAGSGTVVEASLPLRRARRADVGSDLDRGAPGGVVE